MGWGALMGLGQGLQQVGQTVQDNAKEKLKQKLLEAKEARAEQKERMKVVNKRRFQTPEGVWQEVGVNAFGDDVGEARMLNQIELDQITNDAQKAKEEAANRALEKRLTESQITLSEKKLANYDEDRELDIQKTKADIANTNRQYTPEGYAPRASGGRGKVQFTLPSGEEVTDKEAMQYESDTIEDAGQAPKGVADFIGKNYVRSAKRGVDLDYQAPAAYTELSPADKEKADAYADLALKLAKAVEKGDVKRADAEAALRKRGAGTMADKFDTWIRMARGR